jgi:hypothetical protein
VAGYGLGQARAHTGQNARGGPERRAWCLLQRAPTGVRGAGLQKQRSGPPGNHPAIRLESSLDLKLVDIAVQLRQEVHGDTEIDNGRGWPGWAAGFVL